MQGRNPMDATQAILTVGEGRGFVVALYTQHPDLLDKTVITAAHCLPYLPPCAVATGGEWQTYRKILGPLGAKATVWAQCLFADPVMDIAVLGAPDSLEFPAEAKAYEKLLASAEYLPVADAPLTGRLQLLSHEGQWFDRPIEDSPLEWLWLKCAGRDIVGAISGSPILSMDGAAVGVLSVGLTPDDLIQTTTLTWCLPMRLLARMAGGTRLKMNRLGPGLR
jgi:hypothetical protein